MKYNPNLMMHASPWTPPTWMKTYKTYEGKVDVNGSALSNTIKKDAPTLSAYALYFRKFVQAWRNEGINLFAVYPQNEPGYVNYGHPSCLWSGAELRDFIRDYLSPEFTNNGITCQIWLGTFNRSSFDADVKPTLDDAQSKYLIKGCGFQWGGYTAMGQTYSYNQSLKLRLMQTENICHGGANSWADAEDSFDRIHKYFTNYANSYMFWNMILNSNYNAYWMPRAQNAMISIDINSKIVYYNPEFYLMSTSAFILSLAQSGSMSRAPMHP